MFQESFLRQGVKEFPFPESQLFKTLVANFHHCQNYGEGRCCSQNSTTNSKLRVYEFRFSLIIVLTDKINNVLITNVLIINVLITIVIKTNILISNSFKNLQNKNKGICCLMSRINHENWLQIIIT